MKKVILFSLCMLAFSACTATPNSKKISVITEKTTEMSHLKNALNTYSNATINNDVTTLLSFVYPKVFTLISKERMKKTLTNVYASRKAPNITDIDHQKISSIMPYDAGLYSIIDSKMTMKLKSPVVDNEKLEVLLYDRLKSQMGTSAEITHDKRNHIFIIKKKSQIIGIKEGSEGWKFVGYEQAKKYASKKVIPQSIMKNLK
ncbi:MAG: hypothetical protein KAG56_00920 [Sulfurovaceae bacterium]|nr:hypothetical protein [Sulfurovaceae bacterium]